jgi:hypothetical protein
VEVAYLRVVNFVAEWASSIRSDGRRDGGSDNFRGCCLRRWRLLIFWETGGFANGYKAQAGLVLRLDAQGAVYLVIYKAGYHLNGQAG